MFENMSIKSSKSIIELICGSKERPKKYWKYFGQMDAMAIRMCLTTIKLVVFFSSRHKKSIHPRVRWHLFSKS